MQRQALLGVVGYVFAVTLASLVLQNASFPSMYLLSCRRSCEVAALARSRLFSSRIKSATRKQTHHLRTAPHTRIVSF